MMTFKVVESGEVVIVLVELGLVEQRYQAVLEVLNDASTVTDVAVRFGVTRQTVHRWLRRYASRWDRRPGGSRVDAGFVSASDASGGGGPHRGAPPSQSWVGSENDPVPTRSRTRLTVAGSVVDLSVFGPSRSDRTGGETSQEGGLQAVGTIEVDGVVADGRRRWRPTRRWVEGVDRVWGG